MIRDGVCSYDTNMFLIVHFMLQSLGTEGLPKPSYAPPFWDPQSPLITV